MRRFNDLPIRVKFYSSMALLLLVLVLAAGFLSYEREERYALRFAVDNARSIAHQIIETRDYMSSVVRGEPEHNYALVPQVVATQVAKRLTQHSGYYVRQVSLRYRNPNNSPDPYETKYLKEFATRPPHEVYGIVRSDDQRYFRYLLPMIATPSCLECHGSYQNAPDFVKRRFPPGHYSYNYKIGEVIGAVSVKIPVKDLYAQLGTDLKLDLLTRGLVLLTAILFMGAVLRRHIVDPIKRLSEGIVRVTRTGTFAEKIPQRSNDEIGRLIHAFNDMTEELERRTVQSREADDRYRRFIEVANAAVVTFMQDGKILITNPKAETLFGRSGKSLLGESLFGLLSGGNELKERISRGLEQREETMRQTVKRNDGTEVETEMVIIASKTDREPMFTAILRERNGK